MITFNEMEFREMITDTAILLYTYESGSVAYLITNEPNAKKYAENQAIGTVQYHYKKSPVFLTKLNNAATFKEKMSLLDAHTDGRENYQILETRTGGVYAT